MAEPIADPNEDTRTQSILLAASHHDLEYLRTLLRSGSANVQDAESGYTPLHAAIAACETRSDVRNNDVSTNGHSTNVTEDHNNITPDPTADRDAAIKTVKLLLQNGAIWNDLDKNNETPGCLALRLGIKDLYDLMVDAGVRAEMLLSRLDEYEQLADDDDDDDDKADVTESSNQEGNEGEGQECAKPNREEPVQDAHSTGESQNHLYLNSSLRFQDRRILDDDDNGVMMAWETDIMKRTANALAPRPGLRILNIGHGMGIIDTFFQSNSPSSHHIVEAHPGVLARMREEGWYEKPGVTIQEGRWQGEFDDPPRSHTKNRTWRQCLQRSCSENQPPNSQISQTSSPQYSNKPPSSTPSTSTPSPNPTPPSASSSPTASSVSSTMEVNLAFSMA